MMQYRQKILIAAVVGLVLGLANAASAFNPFASEVIEYTPAPGGLVNNPDFCDPSKALGVPVGGGIYSPNNSSVVTLGGFGGRLVLAFDHDVKDDPGNLHGIDAIVFTNTCWAFGSPQAHWSEFATIEIMPELNDDYIPASCPGEKWYIIRSSHFAADKFRAKTWYDTAPGYPMIDNWPESYSTDAFEMFPNYQLVNGQYGIVLNPNMSTDPGKEGFWGLAEYTPTLVLQGDPNIFYTTPDDPFKTEIDAGTGGGDGVDIAWAIDPETQQNAHLVSFRYIRLKTAVDKDLGTLGEVSAEIDAVSDVRSRFDQNANGIMDYADLFSFCNSWLQGTTQMGFKEYSRFAAGWVLE